jgi:hypothetical protein
VRGLNLGREVGCLGNQEGWLSLEVDGGPLAWGYTDGLGNLDVDVVGATDSLTGDVMVMVMPIIAIVTAVVVIFEC